VVQKQDMLFLLSDMGKTLMEMTLSQLKTLGVMIGESQAL
jgi:hypothetical protein